jgi:hypothetical protein
MFFGAQLNRSSAWLASVAIDLPWFPDHSYPKAFGFRFQHSFKCYFSFFAAHHAYF